MVWTLQDAKNKFSEVVERARTQGPQHVTKRGKDAVVILSAEEWSRLKSQGSTLADFFLSSPLADSGLELARDPSPVRPADL